MSNIFVHNCTFSKQWLRPQLIEKESLRNNLLLLKAVNESNLYMRLFISVTEKTNSYKCFVCNGRENFIFIIIFFIKGVRLAEKYFLLIIN